MQYLVEKMQSVEKATALEQYSRPIVFSRSAALKVQHQSDHFGSWLMADESLDIYIYI